MRHHYTDHESGPRHLIRIICSSPDTHPDDLRSADHSQRWDLIVVMQTCKERKILPQISNSFFSARQQSLVTGPGVGCWLSRDDHNNSWHNHDIMTLLTAYFLPPGTTEQRNWIRKKLFFWFDLFQRIMHFLSSTSKSALSHKTFRNSSVFSSLLSRSSELSHPGPRVGALGPGQHSRAHSEHINT